MWVNVDGIIDINLSIILIKEVFFLLELFWPKCLTFLIGMGKLPMIGAIFLLPTMGRGYGIGLFFVLQSTQYCWDE